MDTILQTLTDVWTLSLLLAAYIALPNGIIQGFAGFGGALFAGPELLALLAKSRSNSKGPNTDALAIKKMAINAAVFGLAYKKPPAREG